MSGIGILADNEGEKKRIKENVELWQASLGYDVNVCVVEEEREVIESNYLILAYQDREEAFLEAERLWKREPKLQIIYVAYKIEDIFAALRKPFFHIVRYFDMEEDFKVSFRKMERTGIRTPERVSFLKNGQTLLFQGKEILYLESEKHEIQVHSKDGIFRISETLTECEKKLKKQGFVRIDRSFLVNMYHIRTLDREKAVLSNGEYLYVSRRRYPEVKMRFEHYIRRLDFI